LGFPNKVKGRPCQTRKKTPGGNWEHGRTPTKEFRKVLDWIGPYSGVNQKRPGPVLGFDRGIPL